MVCLASALAIYNLTEEIPRQHWIGIRHGTSAKSNSLVKIIRFRDFELGKTEIELDGARQLGDAEAYRRDRTKRCFITRK